MDKFDRIFQIHSVLSARRTPIELEALAARLECSRSTLFRLIGLMRARLGAPIDFDTERGGFVYRRTAAEDSYQLPGLWFSSVELQCLAVLQRLLKDLGGGFLAEQVSVIEGRLKQLLTHRRLNLGEAATRLRFPTVARRPVGESFQVVTSATLQRKKLWLEYHSRSTDRRSERTVSPQRIIHYRDVWYLDAWDEASCELRTFSMDRIQRPRVLGDRAKDISDDELDDHFTTGYGIFGGKADKTAILRFSSERARWVSAEEWHPSQQGEYLPDGSYELRVPYRHSHELVMDILRHGPWVRVISPQSLREEVRVNLAQALRQYSKNGHARF